MESAFSIDWKEEYREQSMRKATINKNAMSRPKVTDAWFVLNGTRQYVCFKWIVALDFAKIHFHFHFHFRLKHHERKLFSHLSTFWNNNRLYWKVEYHTGNTNPARAALIHPTTKNFKPSLAKSLARIWLFLFLVSSISPGFSICELVATYHQLSPFSQVEV